MEAIKIQLCAQTLHLHPWRALYWEEAEVLLLADLHLGKATHFRQRGFPVPAGVSEQNWDKLSGLLLDFRPRQVMVLGDLFHSTHNAEWDDFQALLRLFGHIEFALVRGNHDILAADHYQAAHLTVHAEPFPMGPFALSHHPLPAEASLGYNLAGHLHPAVRLRGRGRQSLRLPCFYFGARQGILPAFGEFTGLSEVAAQPGDRLYAITAEAVVAVD